MRAADRIVVLTDAQKEDFRLRWGRGLPSRSSRTVRIRSTCRRAGYDPRLVVVMGRLDYYKRWDTRDPDDGPGPQEGPRRAASDLRHRRGPRPPARGHREAGHHRLGHLAGYTTCPNEVMAHAACVLEHDPAGGPAADPARDPGGRHPRRGPRHPLRPAGGRPRRGGRLRGARGRRPKAAARAVVRLLPDRTSASGCRRPPGRSAPARYSRQAHDASCLPWRRRTSSWRPGRWFLAAVSSPARTSEASGGRPSSAAHRVMPHLAEPRR